MSFMKPTCTFSRFKISDEFDDSLWGVIQDKLRQFRFQSIDDLPENESWGWTTFESRYDTEWKNEYPVFGGDYVCFGLRGDVRRIPYDVMLKGVHEAMEEEQKRNSESGKKFISRERKAELREQVKLRLQRRFLPTPSHYQVIWRWSTGEVWVSTNQSKQIKMFQELFYKTFQLDLSPLDWYNLAGDKKEQMDYIESVGHAGCEFLLWLWFQSERNYILRAEEGYQASIFVQNNVTLSSRAGTITVTGTKDTREALVGVTKGKALTSMQVSVMHDTDEYVFTIRSDLSLASVKTPPVDTADDDPDGAFLEKMYLLQRLVTLIDNAYNDFVEVRINTAEWSKISYEIKEWAEASVNRAIQDGPIG